MTHGGPSGSRRRRQLALLLRGLEARVSDLEQNRHADVPVRKVATIVESGVVSGPDTVTTSKREDILFQYDVSGPAYDEGEWAPDNKALDFDGADSLDAPDNKYGIDASNRFTLAGWADHDPADNDAQEWNPVISLRGQVECEVRNRPDVDQLEGFIDLSTDGKQFQTWDYSTDGWNRPVPFVLRYDEATVDLFVEGDLQDSDDVTDGDTIVTGTGDVVLVDSFVGIVDDLIVADRAWTDSEIADHAAGDPPTDMVAHWRFDSGAAATARDYAGTNDGTITGATIVPGISP